MLRLRGARVRNGWRGQVSQLDVEMPGVAQLSLQQPVDLSWAGRAFDLARACFGDGDIRLCLEGRGGADGSLQGKYELANLPLALALGMVLTPPDVISQTLLAVPMWLLFEAGIVMSRILLPHRKTRAADPADQATS
jgi:hypothetical protein